jgi:hypothetical protein
MPQFIVRRASEHVLDASVKGLRDFVGGGGGGGGGGSVEET